MSPTAPASPAVEAYLPELPRLMVDRAVEAALLEDLGRAGDITAQATIPPSARAIASFATRQVGVISGIDFAMRAMAMMDPSVRPTPRMRELRR